MNYYRHYIGDFQRDTGHLSLTERGAYLTLIHHYYATEIPLPHDVNSLCRIAGAVTKPERDAVKFVMSFFEVTSSGLMNCRIEAELEKSGERANKNREIALAREEKRRAERMAKNKHETSTKRAHNVPTVEHETSTKDQPIPTTNNQEPISLSQSSSTHTEIYSEHGEPARVMPTTTAGECCRAMVDAGISGCNPSHPTLTALIEAGASATEFANAARSAVAKQKTSFAYTLGIVQRQREEAAKLVLHQGRMPNKQEALENSNRAVASRWVPPELAQGGQA